MLLIDTDLGADFVPGANVVTVTSLNPPKRVQTENNVKVVKDGSPVMELVPPIERGFYHRTGPEKGNPMPVYSLAEVLHWLTTNWTALPYQTVVIDTVDEVNCWIEDIVTAEMGIEQMGDAGWGADWGKARRKNLDIIKRFQQLVKQHGGHLVLIAHAKSTQLTDEKVQLGPDLPRGLGYALTAKADVIGYTTARRDTGEYTISFRAYDERTVGSRLRPLAQKELPFDYQAIRAEISQYQAPEEQNHTPAPQETSTNGTTLLTNE